MNLTKVISAAKSMGIDVSELIDNLEDFTKDLLSKQIDKQKKAFKELTENLEGGEYEDKAVKYLNDAVNIPMISEKTEEKYIRRTVKGVVKVGKPYALEGVDSMANKLDEESQETISKIFDKLKG